MNLIVDTMTCTCICYAHINFVNCPAVICSPNMLVIYHGETPLVNCEPRSIILYQNTQSTAIIILCIFLQVTIIFHTIRLTLCFQQASEIDNLTVSLRQSILIVLCAGSTSTDAVDTFENNSQLLLVR